MRLIAANGLYRKGAISKQTACLATDDGQYVLIITGPVKNPWSMHIVPAKKNADMSAGIFLPELLVSASRHVDVMIPELVWTSIPDTDAGTDCIMHMVQHAVDDAREISTYIKAHVG